MLYLKPPASFNPKYNVVGCYCESNKKILLLLRQSHLPQGNKWALPAGKKEKGESRSEAMIRELKEEIGITVSSKELIYLCPVYVKYPDYDFVYHTYKVIFALRPKIRINPKEAQKYIWKTPKEALRMKLLLDQDTSFKMFYRI